jgi:hypothetical protein
LALTLVVPGLLKQAWNPSFLADGIVWAVELTIAQGVSEKSDVDFVLLRLF